MFTVHYGCLKAFTLEHVELGRPLGFTGYTKELQMPGNRMRACVCVCLSSEWMLEWLRTEGMLSLVRSRSVTNCVCVLYACDVEWQVKEKNVGINMKNDKKSCYSVCPVRALRINLAGVTVPYLNPRDREDLYFPERVVCRPWKGPPPAVSCGKHCLFSREEKKKSSTRGHICMMMSNVFESQLKFWVFFFSQHWEWFTSMDG